MNWKNRPGGVLAALLAIHIVAHIDRNMLLGFSPQITHDLGLNNAQYGLLAGAVWVLSYGVMAVMMGTLADRYSRTRVIAAGLLVWSVCTVASGMAQSFEQMVAARFLVASGEAALVPAAVSLLSELFSDRRRGSAVGVFFMGIPAGIGLSFLLAGTIGAVQGWRGTFFLLGAFGVATALPLLLLDDRRETQGPAERGAPFLPQLRGALAAIRANPVVMATIMGFVLLHLVFAGLSFAQLWLVRERGFDAAVIARQIGLLQIVFGTLGAVVGGVLSDRLAGLLRGGHAGFVVLLIAVCGPLMVAARLTDPGSALFYIGLCAGFFLPLAAYGPAIALIQGGTPVQMRSTVTGLTMLLLNVLAIAVGNLAAGVAIDRMGAAGIARPMTTVLLVTDVIALSAILCFLYAAARSSTGPQLRAGLRPSAG